ncbi:hypothetical protein [Streptomyces flavofungini]|uniref:hypothetical protein n=1 Tax=Streptomyces flavofungini TaxID=68200 RepID=UPI0034DF3242
MTPYVCTLSDIPPSASEARAALGDFLDEQDWRSASGRMDALLAVSELVADAQQHSAGIGQLSARTFQYTLELTLDYLPGARTAPRSGLGWSIVNAVARGVTLTESRDAGCRARVLMDLA